MRVENVRALGSVLGLLGAIVVAIAGCKSTADDAGATAIDPTCGRLTKPCPAGGKCEGGQDCADKLCRANVCQAVNPADGTKDGDETDTDCGGTHAPACADGKGCIGKDDCTSSVCTANLCAAPTPHDGVKNGDESDVDCGGVNAPKCAVGAGCNGDVDCANVKCSSGKICASAAHDDGLANGDETGIDCGGPTAPTKCAPGQGCDGDGDCNNVRCNATAHTCNTATHGDGLANGDETDVDCGGPTASTKCAVSAKCKDPADCASDGCDYNGKCIAKRSCAAHFGGDTCGKREIGQAGETHESCCETAPIPGNTAVKMGKYEITSGRVREFVKRTGGDIHGWVVANRAKTAQIADQLLPYLPTGMASPTANLRQCTTWSGDTCTASAVVSRRWGVLDQLGARMFYDDRPCKSCGQGCFVNTTTMAFGHNTYWFDAGTQSSEWTASARDFDQATLDQKSQNCVAQFMLAAFCAWDGGRLPTQEELGGTPGVTDSAWGPGNYPWSPENSADYHAVWDAADPGKTLYPNETTNFLVSMVTNNTTGDVVADAPDRNMANWNPFGWPMPHARYVWPQRPANTWDRSDQAYAIAAPGRMTRDRRNLGAGTLDGFFDVTANVMEVTATQTGPDTDGGTNHHLDAAGNPFQTYSWVGGSWEGHDPQRGGYNLSVMTKYGKMGGRCAYDN